MNGSDCHSFNVLILKHTLMLFSAMKCSQTHLAVSSTNWGTNQRMKHAQSCWFWARSFSDWLSGGRGTQERVRNHGCWWKSSIFDSIISGTAWVSARGRGKSGRKIELSASWWSRQGIQQDKQHLALSSESESIVLNEMMKATNAQRMINETNSFKWRD